MHSGQTVPIIKCDNCEFRNKNFFQSINVLRIDIIREIILFCQSKSSNNKKHSPTVFLFSRLLSLVWVPLCLLEKETTRGHSLGPDKNQLIRSMTIFQFQGKNPRQQDRTVRHRERRQNPRPLPNGLRDEHGGRS